MHSKRNASTKIVRNYQKLKGLILKDDILTVEGTHFAQTGTERGSRSKAYDGPIHESNRNYRNGRHDEAHMFPPAPDASELSIACFAADYSASHIARAVEDCDAHLLNLNVTDSSTPAGEMIIDLRVDHRNPSSVARSLERYGYSVIDMRHADDDADVETARRRINELIARLEV